MLIFLSTKLSKTKDSSATNVVKCGSQNIGLMFTNEPIKRKKQETSRAIIVIENFQPKHYKSRTLFEYMRLTKKQKRKSVNIVPEHLRLAKKFSLTYEVHTNKWRIQYEEKKCSANYVKLGLVIDIR